MMAASAEEDLSNGVMKKLTWGVVSRGYDDDSHLFEDGNDAASSSSSSSFLNDDFGDTYGSAPVSDDKKNRILR